MTIEVPSALYEIFEPREAQILTVISKRVILGIEWSKKINEDFEKFTKEILPVRESFIRKKENEIKDEMIKNNIPLSREWYKGVYFLTTPLNDLYSEAHWMQESVNHFNKETTFFRDKKWWSGPLKIQDISDQIGENKRETERILLRLEGFDIIEKSRYICKNYFNSPPHFFSSNIKSFWYSIKDNSYVDMCRCVYKMPEILNDLRSAEAI